MAFMSNGEDCDSGTGWGVGGLFKGGKYEQFEAYEKVCWDFVGSLRVCYEYTVYLKRFSVSLNTLCLWEYANFV